jgi:hypothetical protein
MKKQKKEHPEVTDIENICEITPKSPQTDKVCEQVKKHSGSKQKTKSDSEPGRH